MLKNSSAKVLRSKLENYVDTYASIAAENCSMHGWNWYTKVNNVWHKTIVFVFVNIIFWFMIYLCGERLLLLWNTRDNELASQRQHEFDNHTFPNITICHPKFFNKKLLEGKRHLGMAAMSNACVEIYLTIAKNDFEFF